MTTPTDLESRAELLDRVLTRTPADPHDEALAQWELAERVDTAPPLDVPEETLADTFAALLTPWSDEEIEAAKTPWPHVFAHNQTGMYPVGEVSILAAQGREGKTTVEIGVATALVTGHSLADLWPEQGRTVIVYSAEDDRGQFARKVGAQLSILPPSQAVLLKQRLIVPNLDAPEFAPMRSLVTLFEGQPMVSGTVEAIIAAIAPLMDGKNPPGLLVFETASTLSEAEETNPGFRTLILALRRIARELQVAVVLSHHVSQASLANLSELNVSTTDIRGGTALVNNARQCAILINLGSDADPFADNDGRTVLRRLAAPGEEGRLTALVTLDSSKSIAPPPVFFRWVQTEYGPAAVEHPAPYDVVGKPWRKVLEIVRARRAAMREEARDEATKAKQSEHVDKVVHIVARLELAGMQPTASRVSSEDGKSPGWAKRYLDEAVTAGLLTAIEEAVPRTRGPQLVYRLINSTATPRRNEE